MQEKYRRRPACRKIGRVPVVRAKGAEEFGLTTFESQDLADATRRFEEITGTKVAYYTGGHQGIAGFTPPSRPNLIFVRIDQDASTIASVLTHELVHVAKKDKGSKAQELYRLIVQNLTNEEQARAIDILIGKRYAPEQAATELPAFLVADAVTGNNEFGLFDTGKAEALQAGLNAWFDSISELNPSTLKDIPDGEYSRMGPLQSATLPKANSFPRGVPRAYTAMLAKIDGEDRPPLIET